LLLALLMTTLQLSVAAPRAQAQVDIVVNTVNLAGSEVTGTLGGYPFKTRITDFSLRKIEDVIGTARVECAVLHLELAPIHLDVLGLIVDTSAICLDITADRGGGVLGSLLCSLADGGILTIPQLINSGLLGSLQDALADVLNQALRDPRARPTPGRNQSVCTGNCEILELVLGPVHLELLGLIVDLDNCRRGPVQICVSASRTGLLGNLLCGLTNAQRANLSWADILQLLGTAGSLVADGTLSRRDQSILVALLSQLIST